jgi:phage terminase small subunit
VKQRGRKSAEALAVVSVDGSPPRLEPPSSLNEAEKDVFVDIVENCDPHHFRPGDLPLLARYCESTVLAQRAAAELRDGGAVTPEGKASAWLIVSEKATRALVALSGRLRLSPQARSPAAVNRPVTTGPKPWDP